MKIGAHESVAGGISKALDRAWDDGCESLQIFVKSPNRWKSAEPDLKDVAEFKEKAKEFGFENIMAHTAYLINLASPKDDIRDNSIAALADELRRCDIYGIPFCVLHPGAPLDSGLEAGIERIVAGIDEVYKDGSLKAMLLLETTAGMGTTIGGRFEHLLAIMDTVEKSDKVGICLDSCHMYSAGYDIVNEYDKVFDEVFAKFGDKVKGFHINDSKFPLNARKDRHELIGKGEISIEFFKRLINDTRFKDVIGALETPVAENYADEIKLLKSFRK